MVLTIKILDEILGYLDDSISKLAHEMLKSSEFHMDNNFEEFLSSQYDVRLDNLLQKKNSNIHHLESGMKNLIIQRKQKLIGNILNL